MATASRPQSSERAGRRGTGGQASVELLAGVPLLLLVALIGLQLLAAGYSLTLADGAAEAGALALSSRRPVLPAVRESLPGWAKERIGVRIAGGRVSVSLQPPSPLPALGRALTVESEAWSRPPEGE